MELNLLHFTNDKNDKEYVVILEPADEAEHFEDAKADGYTLANKCPLEGGDITLPIRSVLIKEY